MNFKIFFVTFQEIWPPTTRCTKTRSATKLLVLKTTCTKITGWFVKCGDVKCKYNILSTSLCSDQRFLKKLLKFYLSKIFIKPQIYQYWYLLFLFSKPEVILSIPVYETTHNLGMFQSWKKIDCVLMFLGFAIFMLC